MNENMHKAYMWISPIVIVVLIILVIYLWKKSNKESLCLCSGAQLYRECREKTDAMYGVTDTVKGPETKGMPYDTQINGGYANFGGDC